MNQALRLYADNQQTRLDSCFLDLTLNGRHLSLKSCCVSTTNFPAAQDEGRVWGKGMGKSSYQHSYKNLK